MLLSFQNYAQSDFNKMVRDSEAFRTVADSLGLEPGSVHFIHTSFLIEADGSISNITASSAYPELEPEAIRIIATMPKFNFSNSDGQRNFPQKIGMPITYRVESSEMKKLRLRKEARIKKTN
jgi:hypothetical protein